MDGMPEEISPFYVALLGQTDAADALGALAGQAPAVLAHEFFHDWRHVSGNLSNDAWFEELAANRLALAYCGERRPGAVERTAALARRIAANTDTGLEPTNRRVLERLLSSDCGPDPDAPPGYGMTLEQTMLVQAALSTLSWEIAISARWLPSARPAKHTLRRALLRRAVRSRTSRRPRRSHRTP
jgi:hypothetical protein